MGDVKLLSTTVVNGSKMNVDDATPSSMGSPKTSLIKIEKTDEVNSTFVDANKTSTRIVSDRVKSDIVNSTFSFVDPQKTSSTKIDQKVKTDVSDTTVIQSSIDLKMIKKTNQTEADRVRKQWKFVKKHLNSDVLTEALKSTQKLINRVETNKEDINNYRQTIESLQKYIKDLEVNDQNLKITIGELQSESTAYQLEIETRDDTIQYIDEELNIQKILVRNINKEKTDLENKIENEIQTDLKDLKTERDRLNTELIEAKQNYEVIRKKMEERIKESEEILKMEQEKWEREIYFKENTYRLLDKEINEANKELIKKDILIEQLTAKSEGMKLTLQMNGQHASNSYHYISDENHDLKVKMAHYQKSIKDLKETYGLKESEFRRHIQMLENELQKDKRSYECFDERLKHIQKSLNDDKQQRAAQQLQHAYAHAQQKQQLDSQYRDKTFRIQNNINDTRVELDQTLKELADSAKTRNKLMFDMKNKNIDQVKISSNAYNVYNNKEMKLKKLNRISISNNEKEGLMQRLKTTQEAMKNTTRENEELSLDNSLCKQENTKLAERVKRYKEQLQEMEEILDEKTACKDENTKLANRVHICQDKLKNLDEEIATKNEFKAKCQELQNDIEVSKSKIENCEREKASLHKAIVNFQNDIEFYRKSSQMHTGGCCFELKIKKEQLENQVSQLEKNLKISQEYKDKENDTKRQLEKYERENEDLRRRAEISRGDEQGKKTAEQPTVNVHVHLDPQSLKSQDDEDKSILKFQLNNLQKDIAMMKSDATNAKMNCGEEKTQNGANERIVHDDGEIQMLVRRNEELDKQLKISELKIDNLHNALHDVDAVKHSEKQNSSSVARKQNDEEIQSLKKQLDSAKQENKELHDKIVYLEKQILELQSEKKELNENLDEIECVLKEKEAEKKDRDIEAKQMKDRQRTELQTLKEQLTNYESQFHSMSNNGKIDLESLRNKVQDLSSKKEKNEALIERIKEEKANLQMNVDKLERELDNTKQNLEFKEVQRGHQRRNATPVVEMKEDEVEQNEPKKPGFPLWLDSASNNEKNMKKESEIYITTAEKPKIAANSTPIWLAAKQPDPDNNKQDITLSEPPKSRRQLGSANGFGEDFFNAPLKQQKNDNKKQDITLSEPPKSRRQLGSANGFGEDFFNAPLKQQKTVPQQQQKNVKPQQKQQNINPQPKNTQVKNKIIAPQNGGGFLDDFNSYVPTGLMTKASSSKKENDEDDFLRLDTPNPYLQSRQPQQQTKNVGPRDRRRTNIHCYN